MLGEEMNHLVDEIQSSREERNQFITTLNGEVQEVLSGYRDQLSEEVLQILEDYRDARSQLGSKQRKALSDFMQNLRQETGELLGGFREASTNRGEEIATLLSESADKRNTELDVLRNEFTATMRTIGEEQDALRSQTGEFLQSLQESRAEAKRAWATAGEVESQPAAEVEEEAEAGEEIKSRVQAALREAGEGLRLPELGERVGQSWQGLIPVVNEMIEEDTLLKEEEGVYSLPEE